MRVENYHMNNTEIGQNRKKNKTKTKHCKYKRMWDKGRERDKGGNKNRIVLVFRMSIFK